MNRDWARLGRALAAARDQHGFTQEEVAARLGIAKSTLQFIEHGRQRKKVTPTIRAYAQLVEWADGSVDKVLAGDSPELAAAAATDGAEPAQPAEGSRREAPSDLSLRVLHALTEGPLIDSQVITVPTAGGTATATIVVRGEPDASPEELHQALLAWRDRERALRRNEDEHEGS